MSYIDNGFNNLMYRETLPTGTVETSEAQASTQMSLLTGTSITGGIMKSATGKVQIDWEKGQILVGDGANWRVLIGEDGL